MELTTIGANWEFSYTGDGDTRFDLLLTNDDKFSYKIPCHIFKDANYLERSQCNFILNGNTIVPDGNVYKLEYKKNILLKLKLSPDAAKFLNGMSLALITHKVTSEDDKLLVSPSNSILITQDVSVIEWTIESDVAVGHRFTLEIAVENLKSIISVIKCVSV